jgi:hypothetical protein
MIRIQNSEFRIQDSELRRRVSALPLPPPPPLLSAICLPSSVPRPLSSLDLILRPCTGQAWRYHRPTVSPYYRITAPPFHCHTDTLCSSGNPGWGFFLAIIRGEGVLNQAARLCRPRQSWGVGHYRPGLSRGGREVGSLGGVGSAPAQRSIISSPTWSHQVKVPLPGTDKPQHG